MEITVNGDVLTVKEDITNIEELVQELHLEKKSLIVEHNQTILKKDKHKETAISEGDKLEIVHFVGGG
ncbi:sulfur carrier protein [Gracilibacillus orientalis]|uniref:Sulfur carrier protein n=1 Tax=Gracilibacillus orientalis TaxID=334253 RepID=A0A1I4HD42_9BACI|nr:sulfur carrier protein ThiS [Gracilibacillus orientalis]SFL40114.1 sulfur carrier protein [Gracilibacillus orientalis]